MKDRHRIFANIYSVVWAILLAAFVVLGARQVWIGPSDSAYIHPTPFASTDAYFEQAFLEAPTGSRRCLEIMRQLYGKGAIIFFFPPQDVRGSLGFALIGYLSWPQSISKVESRSIELKQRLGSLDRSATAAVIFCDLPPPPEFAVGWQIGPMLFIAPLDQAK